MTQITDKQKVKRKKTVERLVFDMILFVILLSIGIILLYKSFGFESEKIVRYSEKSDLDYKVYLVKNDFYEQEYLGKDMLYVANLIDHIAIDFKYNFTSEEAENIDFTYSVVAKLSITNAAATKSYFDKSYVLLKDKKVSMSNVNSQTITEEIKLDYPYYNKLANSFKNQYGVDPESKLTVYMLINKKNADEASYVLDSSSSMNVVIPLSERSVDIRLDYKEIDETSKIIKRQSMAVKDYIPFGVAALFIILAIIMMIKGMRNAYKLRTKKSAYDKFVGKILKEYDRLIAESSTILSFDDKEIISISKFTELLDIHDNLQIPIMYYEKLEHELGYFYIAHDKVVYLFEVDANKLQTEIKK